MPPCPSVPLLLLGLPPPLLLSLLLLLSLVPSVRLPLRVFPGTSDFLPDGVRERDGSELAVVGIVKTA